MAIAVRLVMLTLLASAPACAPSGRVEVANPLSVDLRAYPLVAMVVQATNPTDEAEAHALAAHLAGRLHTAGVRIVDNRARPDVSAPLGVAVTVLAVRRVTQTDRMLAGGMAGRAGITCHVRVVEITTRRVLGEATIEGRSSGGTVFAGTTEQAVAQAGDAVASWLLNLPPPQQ